MKSRIAASFGRIRGLLTLRVVVLSVAAPILLFAVALGVLALQTKGDPMPEKLDRERANTAQNVVNDVTELNPIPVSGIVVVHTLDDIIEAVRSADHVSIGGGRNSMGGQTASTRAIQIDMREYNKILALSTSTKEITVQAGIRWRDIQDAIDPHGLSIMIMQTYSNFTVGGSLSVNVHGRYMGLGPIVLSVRGFHIVLADGSVVFASPTENSEIFYAAIGGMGGIGVISDVTLALAENVNVERSRIVLKTEEYWPYFRDHTRADPTVLFHNGDMYPPDFERVSAVSWSVTDRAPTHTERLIPRGHDYWLERMAWVIMSEWPGGRWIRERVIDPLLYAGSAPVHTRNYEASYDIAELEPRAKDASTYVLQEYFVPVERFDEWVPKMKKVFLDYDVNVINVSIRHALPDSGATLAWARSESFAFVVYYKQGTSPEDRARVGTWTRAMIDAALSVGGTYYLPYQLHATDDQLHRAYPGMVDYFAIKKRYDPHGKFTNALWDRYYTEEKAVYYSVRRAVLAAASTTREYFRPFDNAYLSVPEWYIVYSADEYAAVLRDGLPSDFPYAEANRDYWTQHERVTALTKDSAHDNSGYLMVLNVIGWSYSVENAIKCAYENTIGRMSEWAAGGTQVAEDRFAARVASDYAAFLYDYPWYDFPYASYLGELWALPWQGTESLGALFRRTERKVILTVELGIKAAYSSLIAYATHATFGVQDDIIFAIVTRDGGATSEVISAPHYHPFTRKLLEEFAREHDNAGFQVLDISGNERITFSYLDRPGARHIASTTEVLRDAEIVAVQSGNPELRDRITVEVNVRDLARVAQTLAKDGIAIEHFYDY